MDILTIDMNEFTQGRVGELAVEMIAQGIANDVHATAIICAAAHLLARAADLKGVYDPQAATADFQELIEERLNWLSAEGGAA